MLKELCVTIEDIKNSRLLALFNTLEEIDKDMVITMSELLVEKWKKKTNSVSNNEKSYK